MKEWLTTASNADLLSTLDQKVRDLKCVERSDDQSDKWFCLKFNFQIGQIRGELCRRGIAIPASATAPDCVIYECFVTEDERRLAATDRSRR